AFALHPGTPRRQEGLQAIPGPGHAAGGRGLARLGIRGQRIPEPAGSWLPSFDLGIRAGAKLQRHRPGGARAVWPRK
ncbi:unnamed protein product, partial [Durusdinium trenchii]